MVPSAISGWGASATSAIAPSSAARDPGAIARASARNANTSSRRSITNSTASWVMGSTAREANAIAGHSTDA